MDRALCVSLNLPPFCSQICTYLAREVQLLQAATQPALEALTKKADSTNLEAVRRVKTTHQRLTGKLKVVHEVLERLMGERCSVRCAALCWDVM